MEPGWIRSVGYRLGWTYAGKVRHRIVNCDNEEEISVLAGKSMEEAKNDKDVSISSCAEWSEGFWEGFMDHSEEFVGG